jgi:alkaline phosphatase
MMITRHVLLTVVSVLTMFAACGNHKNDTSLSAGETEAGSVIFIHPDGSGVGMWTAMRLLTAGPEGMTHWDSLSHLGIYRSHQGNSLGTTSHAGATTHAYGVKVNLDTFGSVPEKPVEALSGSGRSIMQEAHEAGLAVGVVNSGHLCEPGTAVFLASSFSRYSYDTISARILDSGAEVILGGGETMLLPEGVRGRHGGTGTRRDGRNLIDEARAAGYAVVFTRDELLALPPETGRVLGVFASGHTFNDQAEEALTAAGLPLYAADAPTVGEMMSAALRILEQTGRRFLLVVEEEGTDNFANENNAAGAIEALRRADEAIGIARTFVETHERSLLVTAADSDAGGMKVWCDIDEGMEGVPLPSMDRNGAPLDGRDGSATPPFLASPDRNGRRLPFAAAWASYDDMSGGVIARAHGWKAETLPANTDNTDIYRLMYRVLFGTEP